jgi:cytochrome c
MKVRRVLLTVGILFAGSIGLSFVHPWGDLRNAAGKDAMLSGANVPTDVRQMLETKCADCHTTRTHWPAYSRIAPGSWLMEHDVHEGREHLNLSAWPQYDTDTRIDLLAKIAAVARKDEMPVKQYLWLHPSARLTEEERQRLAFWAKGESRRIRREVPQQ